MKHVVIVHGWKGRPESNWKPWLKQELEKTKKFTVDIPRMPNILHPVAKEWVKVLADAVSQPSANTYLVGHSLGCMTILRYLESLQTGQKIGAVILVAGFGERFKEYQGQHDSFFDHKLHWGAIREHCNAFIAIHSSDDRLVGSEQNDLFKQQLGATCIVVNGMGHFGSDDGIFELPLVRDQLLGIAQD